jgi:hypothetical protein
MLRQRDARKVNIKSMGVFQAWNLLVFSTGKIFSAWQAITPEISLTMAEPAIPKCQFVLCLRLEPFMSLEGGYYKGDGNNQKQM